MENGLIDFTACPMSNKHGMYGGAPGQKLGIVYKGENWLLKFPRKVGRAPYPLFPIETGFNVLSEYLGTHFYGYLGFPVPETLLGTYEGKLVVAARDFCPNGGPLLSEFHKCANKPVDGEFYGNIGGMELKPVFLHDVLEVINRSDFLEPIRTDLRDRFWDMFIVDTMLGHTGRTCDNWGILINQEKEEGKKLSLAPVYGNGCALNYDLSERAMSYYTEGTDDPDDRFIAEETLHLKSAFLERDGEDEHGRVTGRYIYPFRFIMARENPDCSRAVLRIADRIPEALVRIGELIDTTDSIAPRRKFFYKHSLRTRYEKGIVPAVNDMMEKGLK